MRIVKHDSYLVATCYMPALINGDYSGLLESEAAELAEFENSIPQPFTIEYSRDYRGDVFDRCEVSGLYADCCKITIYIEA